MEPFNIGIFALDIYILVPVLLLIGALYLDSRFRGSQAGMLLSPGMKVVLLLCLQWVLYNVTIGTEAGAASVENESNVFGVSRLGILDASPALVPEHIRTLHSLFLTSFQLLFALALPVVLTGMLLKRTCLNERRVTCISVNRRTLQSYLFVASLRQLCASPDAHGP